jgi:hypothetical protein
MHRSYKLRPKVDATLNALHRKRLSLLLFGCVFGQVLFHHELLLVRAYTSQFNSLLLPVVHFQETQCILKEAEQCVHNRVQL